MRMSPLHPLVQKLGFRTCCFGPESSAPKQPARPILTFPLSSILGEANHHVGRIFKQALGETVCTESPPPALTCWLTDQVSLKGNQLTLGLQVFHHLRSQTSQSQEKPFHCALTHERL